MVLYLLLCNKNNKTSARWLSLPTTEEILYETLEGLANDGKYNDITVIGYTTKLDIDFTIYDGDDLFEINNDLDELNQSVTNKEMIALSEIYSDLFEMNQATKKIDKFYPNKSLEDVANKLANTERYRYYRNTDGDIDYESIVDDLCRLGYKQTSTGVILISGY